MVVETDTIVIQTQESTSHEWNRNVAGVADSSWAYGCAKRWQFFFFDVVARGACVEHAVVVMRKRRRTSPRR